MISLRRKAWRACVLYRLLRYDRRAEAAWRPFAATPDLGPQSGLARARYAAYERRMDKLAAMSPARQRDLVELRLLAAERFLASPEGRELRETLNLLAIRGAGGLADVASPPQRVEESSGSPSNKHERDQTSLPRGLPLDPSLRMRGGLA